MKQISFKGIVIKIPMSIRWRNYCEWYGDDNSSKRCPLSLQYMVFRLLNDYLLHPERMSFANLSQASWNRKQKALRYNKP